MNLHWSLPSGRLIVLAVPLALAVGERIAFSLTLPLLGTVPTAFFVVVGLNGLLGFVDSLSEPASIALFADEEKDGGTTSSFGIRGLAQW